MKNGGKDLVGFCLKSKAHRCVYVMIYDETSGFVGLMSHDISYIYVYMSNLK